MKKLKSMMLYSVMAVFALTSCDKDDDDNNNNTSTNVVKAGLIKSDETWSADKIYELNGRVIVDAGVTLKIEPGTIIKARGGREANASALVIARGATIMAEGTADKPIIFTSVLDEIAIGETVSPNLDESFYGLWGGVIVLGKAKISANASEKQIEGIPGNVTQGLYGGENDADNSGKINYVSIRYGGTLLGEGNEINGLTLGGVGSGTTITNVEIINNLDDGIEFFGGSVNVSNALVWNVGDDLFDIDQSYSGTISNFMGISGSESDHSMEVDGPEGSYEAGFTMEDGTLIGYILRDEDKNDIGGGEMGDFRDGARGTLNNLYFEGFSSSADIELDDNVSSANFLSGALAFNGWVINSTKSIDKLLLDKSSVGGAFAILTEANAKVSTNQGAAGADASAFAWTYAKTSGAF
ncbi:MAG: hypothetical protein CMI35_03785 [Owenweeksia sp.]|nr:hypothetical protein [Owenweeksia sp.]|tara:strand:+ start:25814 stop:27049 length:1236 start_codon:yes stop_codon:yes gene_type:complete